MYTALSTVGISFGKQDPLLEKRSADPGYTTPCSMHAVCTRYARCLGPEEQKIKGCLASQQKTNCNQSLTNHLE